MAARRGASRSEAHDKENDNPGNIPQRKVMLGYQRFLDLSRLRGTHRPRGLRRIMIGLVGAHIVG